MYPNQLFSSIGAIQWPGGCAALGYNWTPPNPSNAVGTDRFLEFCQLTGAEPIICGSHLTSWVPKNVAWLKHIDSTTARLGMDSLKWFKVGNEVWGGCGYAMDSIKYCDTFDAHYNALHAIRSSLKFEACSQNEDRGYASVSGWFTRIIRTLGTRMDGVEYHDYVFHPGDIPSGTFTEQQYWHIMHDGMVGDFAGHMRTNVIPVLNTADPGKRIKLIVDEWGDWLQGVNWMQTITLMDAQSAANQLHLMMGWSDRIGVACMAQGINVIHSLMNIRESDQVMIKTPTFYIFKMFKPHHENGAKWAPQTASNIQTIAVNSYSTGTVTLPVMTVGSTVDNNGRVNISVNNIDLTTSRQITITLTSNASQYGIDSAQIITGPAMNSNNPFGGPEVVNLQNFGATNYSLTNNGKTLTATLPPRSIVMFRLNPLIAVQPVNPQGKGSDAFSIKAGPRGTVLITSSVSRKTPVTVSLYGIDGRTLLDRVSRTFEPGSGACVLGNNAAGNGAFIVRITGKDINLTEKVLAVR